jgi:hypothetical protein
MLQCRGGEEIIDHPGLGIAAVRGTPARWSGRLSRPFSKLTTSSF